MGGSLSCGGCQTGNCLNASTLLTGPSSYRFAAEIFRLSDDRSEWIKVHPTVLSVTVNRKFGNNNETIAELSAANLRQQNVFQMPIHRGDS
uniref:Uncharacterized protein n=1 Tax=Panagrolaimus sp. PS1159 TaxID=55785 RepID=A0AC35G7C4_9BILA